MDLNDAIETERDRRKRTERLTATPLHHFLRRASSAFSSSINR